MTENATKTLVNALVTPKLDYCNSLLVGLPKYLVNKLQRSQNAAARLIKRRSKRSHITPVLKELHWLPIRSRIMFKILLLIFKALNGLAPVYLRNMLHRYTPAQTLRSNELLSGTLVVPRFKKLKHGGRAFSSVAPALWNSIPRNIRTAETISAFKSKLKTYLFRQHYGQ